MEKISNLLLKLSRRLFDNPVEQEKFIEALIHPKPFHPCILWCNDSPAIPPFFIDTPTPWQAPFVDRLSIGEKPGQHPLHESGYYYCLDFSSVFAASTILTIQLPVNLVIVDAPCTGQSLLAKGGKAPGCFHSTAITKSANRQKRIIANSAQLVTPQGYLAYMTCTYSPEENEQVCE